MAMLVLAAGLAVGVWYVNASKSSTASTSNRPITFKSDEARDRYMAAYDAVLRKWPIPYEEAYVPTSLGLTHVIVSGPRGAPPLVLLHAALATAVVWRPNVEGLSRRFRVYAVDVVGQGGKSVASRTIKTRGDYARWMNELFDGLGIKKASIVGNSYGGFIALNQASLAPGRVDRVVLIDPAGVFASLGPLMIQAAYEAAKGQVLALFGAPRPKPLDISFILGGYPHFNPQDKDWLALGPMLLDGSVRMNGILPPVFSRAELRMIKAPTLLLIADHEILYEPRATLRLAKARMPALEGEIVHNAYHLAAMAQPDVVNARIIAFLEPEFPAVAEAGSHSRGRSSLVRALPVEEASFSRTSTPLRASPG
jgi:pimeloyl-ACP methyl ester carboxylesterase